MWLFMESWYRDSKLLLLWASGFLHLVFTIWTRIDMSTGLGHVGVVVFVIQTFHLPQVSVPL